MSNIIIFTGIKDLHSMAKFVMYKNPKTLFYIEYIKSNLVCVYWYSKETVYKRIYTAGEVKELIKAGTWIIVEKANNNREGQ